jgi:iron(III) transport system permease protein
MVQIPPNAIFAARTAGAGLIRVIYRIFVPLLRDTWFRVWLIIFAGVMFELPVSELLYPAGAPTLAVGIMHQVHAMRFGVGAALTVSATVMTGLIIGGVHLLLSLTRRRGSKPVKSRIEASPAREETIV